MVTVDDNLGCLGWGDFEEKYLLVLSEVPGIKDVYFGGYWAALLRYLAPFDEKSRRCGVITLDAEGV